MKRRQRSARIQSPATSALGLSALHLRSSTAFQLHPQRPQSNHHKLLCLKSNKINQENSVWKQSPFDFSSKQGWENFYKNGQISIEKAADADISSLEYEWHSHIPHSTIIQTIAPSIERALDCGDHSDSNGNGKIPSILLVGCGNSSLPRVLHDAFSPIRITCLDYSQVCINMLRDMYSDSYPNIDYVVGDAMSLKEVINQHNREGYSYDIVIDKGLMDALMCGEGFDLDRLQHGIDSVLTMNGWGMHVLICFPLIKGVKDRLVELGEELGTNDGKLFWRFELPVLGSEGGRASFNVGRRSAWGMSSTVEASETDWN